ncbi:MAG: GPR endopeptidase [Oscillibacter sp.]|nr:GPR endopeptidase [Oscillibacter sp.]
MLAKRTDLALEARELWQESAENTGRLSGVRAKTSRQEGCPVTKVEILNDRGAKALGKPCGRYFSVDLKECLHRRDFDRAVRVVGRQLRLLTPREGSLLIVGLGNAAMTPDAIGPLTAQHLLVTRHLISALPEQFGAFRDVAVLTPGVLGSTGIETAEAVRSLAAQLCPAAVIAVDALASRRMSRLCTTVQISDSGIVPGSGVGNHRHALNKEALGVPVIALGVPTVVDAATVAADLLEENGITEISPERLQKGSNVFVTPRDIDAQVRQIGKILGYAINWAFQELEMDEITTLLS